ncbi:TetR family transcriptional regulator C-terminal domain-containing protein [Pseudonocardia sp. NPDC046786]|uniref:TetR/AcrR family transcriptional regulator n=1 Tax=Pseudonocardia sp. NPDC046786 TaxID=3155471 RepID=UPI0033CB4136
MPRHVDPGERRERVAGAVRRVILRDGFPAATVRAVAAEAGLSTGALRHYFGSQAELHAYVFDMLNARADERVAAVDQSLPLRRRVEETIWALMPLTSEQADDDRIRLAFFVAAQTDRSLAPIARADHDQALGLTRRAVVALSGPGADVEGLTAELSALLDGLAQQAAFFPERFTAAEVRAIVRSWFDRNLASEGPAEGTE